MYFKIQVLNGSREVLIIETVNHNFEHIAGCTERNAHNSMECANMSKELFEQVENMNEIISRFKIE